MIPLGVHGYIGAPNTGKTYRAFEDAKELAAHYRCGLIVVDSARTDTLAGVEHVDTVRQLLPVWRKAAALAITPRTVDDFDRIMDLCAEKTLGNCVVLVDEIYTWRRSKNFVWLCRTWRASKCTVLFTTQHASGDVAQDIQAAEPNLYIFRTTSSASLEWLQKWKEVEPEEVRDLPDRTFFELV